MTLTEALAEIDRLRAENAQLRNAILGVPTGLRKLGLTHLQCQVAVCLLDGLTFQATGLAVERSTEAAREIARRIRERLGQATMADTMVILRAAARMP